MRLFLKIVFVPSIVLLLTACGGGESGKSESVEKPQLISGGAADSPVLVSIDKNNEIKSDSFFNYFKISVSAGDTLVVKSTLRDELDGVLHRRCQENGDYAIMLKDMAKSCSLDLKYTFNVGGTYLLHVKYPQGNSGYFNVALNSEGVALNPSINATGRPDDPRLMIVNGVDNNVSSNDFYNNFAYDAIAGDVLHIQAYPKVSPSVVDSRRCRELGGYYSYGIMIDTIGFYNCAEVLEYRFEETGRYFLKIKFPHETEGFFRAVVVSKNS